MNEVEKDVLYKFVELHRVHPNGDVLFLWVQAGGKIVTNLTDVPHCSCPRCNPLNSEKYYVEE